MTWNEIKLLEGQQLQKIGRVANLIWLAIGEMRECMIANKMRLRSTYAIHITCACRVIGINREILFTGDDKYFPKPGVPDDEDFDWDVQDNNLFDHKAKIWFSSNSPIYVSSVEISRLGDLKILFSNGDLFETFVSYSEEESWRFFEPGMDKKHLVASGNTIEYV
jgi:hypothetical protein